MDALNFEDPLKSWPYAGTFAFQRKHFGEEKNESEGNNSSRKKCNEETHILEITEAWHAVMRVTDWRYI